MEFFYEQQPKMFDLEISIFYIQLGKYQLDRHFVAFAGISLIRGSVFSSVKRDVDPSQGNAEIR